MASIEKKKSNIKRVENREKLFTIAASYGVSSNTVSDGHWNEIKLQKIGKISVSSKVCHMAYDE